MRGNSSGHDCERVSEGAPRGERTGYAHSFRAIWHIRVIKACLGKNRQYQETDCKDDDAPMRQGPFRESLQETVLWPTFGMVLIH